MSNLLPKINLTTIALALGMLFFFVFSSVALADPQPLQKIENNTKTGATPSPAPDPISSPACKSPNTASQIQQCVKTNQIVKDLQKIVDVLSVGVALIVVIMVMVGGVQYMTADGPEGVAKARKRISNALLALVAFLFIDAFIQWLIPGGIFG